MSPGNDLLQRILSTPTAPFREQRVFEVLEPVLEAGQVPFFRDTIGNLILGAKSPAQYRALAKKKSLEPLRVFIAHLDHPGFHGERWIEPGRKLAVTWHGGSPTAALEGTRVWVCGRGGPAVDGVLREATLLPSGKAIQAGVVEFGTSTFATDKAPTLFGGFGFSQPVWRDGEFLYTKAADDLVGAYAIVQLALELWGTKGPAARVKQTGFLGVLTRAEEVGFIGAIGHFELGWLARPRRPIVPVSLETSRTLPGAEIGKGPIVRLGDRTGGFDPRNTEVLSQVALKRLPGAHQRRIMDGGSCEATAALTYGLSPIGISVPLGNYHNQSLEGGPEAGPPNAPAPEFVHQVDVEGLLTLCRGLLEPKLGWQAPFAPRLEDFKKSLKRYRPLLELTP